MFLPRPSLKTTARCAGALPAPELLRRRRKKRNAPESRVIHKACTHAGSKQSSRYCRGKLPLQCSVVRPFCLAHPCGCIYPIRSRRFLGGRSRSRELVYSRVLNCLPRTKRYLMMLTFKCKEELWWSRNKDFWTWCSGWGSHCQSRLPINVEFCNANYVLSIRMIFIYK